jgi:hypothetical protein
MLNLDIMNLLAVAGLPTATMSESRLVALAVAGLPTGNYIDQGPENSSPLR